MNGWPHSRGTIHRSHSPVCQGIALPSTPGWFFLSNFLVFLATQILDAAIGVHRFSLFNVLWLLGALLLDLAVLVRRLRDAGYAWPSIFIAFVPLAGGILLVFPCTASKRQALLAVPLACYPVQ